MLAPTLKSLILHETEFNLDFLKEQIYACKNLEFLDISKTLPSQSQINSSDTFERPDCENCFELGDIIQKLPNLHSVDLSGTDSGIRSGENFETCILTPRDCENLEFYGVKLKSNANPCKD